MFQNPGVVRPNSARPASLAAAMMMGVSPAVAADDVAPEFLVADVIRVTGQRNGDHGVGIATLRAPVIDTPQIVSTVSSELLQQRNVTSLEQALRNVAGVTTAVGEGGVLNGDQFFIRGQSAKNDIFTDGLRDFGAFTRDSFNYESVQVLKGSSSTVLGRGATGGGVNTVSKAPTQEDFAVVTGGYGSADYKRVTGDANWTLGESSAFRLNAMWTDTDAVDRDEIYSERFGVAPSIAFGLGTDTVFKAIYFHQSEKKLVDYGVPVALTSGGGVQLPVTEYGVPRSNFYGFLADTDEIDVNTLTFLFAHEANDWLTLTSDTKLGVYGRTFRQTVPGCRTDENCGDFLIDDDPSTIPLARTTPRGAYDQTTRGVQNVSTAFITAPLGEMRNELLIGWDVSYQTNDRSDEVRPDPYIQDLFNPVRQPEPNYSTAIYSQRDTRGTDYSVFINEQIWLLPTFSLSAGVRYQHFGNEQEQIEYSTSSGEPLTACNGATGAFTTCVYTRTSEHDLVSPKFAALWEPADTLSFYAAYSKALTPPGNAVGNGDTLQALAADGSAISRADLDPEEAETFDIGAKLSLFDKRLLVQTAIYQINRENSVEIDPVTNNIVASGEPKQRLRGFELGVSGAVSADFSVTANYAFIDADIREAYSGSGAATAPDPSLIGNQVTLVPRHSFSFWGNYAPNAGPFEGAEAGLGLAYQSDVYLDEENLIVLPSYVSLDALIAYSFGRVRVALNAYNLTDELYYAQGQSSRAVPAPGRSFIGSVGVSF